MRSMLATAAFRVLAAQGAVVSDQEPEAAFVACLKEKRPDIIAKIRDASGEDAFLSALKQGADICSIKVEGMSMGKLFRALNAHKQDDTDA